MCWPISVLFGIWLGCVGVYAGIRTDLNPESLVEIMVWDGRGVLGVSPSVRIRTGPSCDYFEQRRLRQAHYSEHIHCSYAKSLNQFESDKQYTQCLEDI